MCLEKCFISKHSFYSEPTCGKAKEKFFKTFSSNWRFRSSFKRPSIKGSQLDAFSPQAIMHYYQVNSNFAILKNLKLFSIRIESKIIILAYSFAKKKKKKKKSDMFFCSCFKSISLINRSLSTGW